MKVSIVIPNYNGENLLPGTLPDILKSGADEVLVIDDCSKDNSVEIIKNNFPQVKLLLNKTNLGFSKTVNKLFEEAQGDVVVLLNNDVYVDKDFLKPLVKHFNSDKVFAVNCHEKSGGFAKSFWKDGFYEHSNGGQVPKLHKSAWASGGSAAFSKKIWHDLGGFDHIYKPGYWEDIDISFQALKKGYDIYWEPKAKVIHEHGTTMEKSIKRKKIVWIQQRNQLLFIWKNITDKNLNKDHYSNLFKRLLGGMGIGYWIPFLWALSKSGQIQHYQEGIIRSDEEVINYASDNK